MHVLARTAVVIVVAASLSCRASEEPAATETAAEAGTSTAASDPGDDGERATMVHSFGVTRLGPFEETEPCVQWTLGNDKPLYVNAVTLVNDGGYHHSNWLTVPEDKFPGPDGFFRCSDRGYTELEAAISGTVVFAQSTQSRSEVQQLPPGVVIKIPPRHKIIAGVHLLNLANVSVETELRMALDLIHPRDVEVLVAPFRMTYYDLAIPAQRRSRFTGACRLAGPYVDAVGGEFDLKLYHVLPHTHYLGDYFRLETLDAEGRAEVVYEKTGFDADANGKTFDPPLDLSRSDGLRFACGFDNWRDVPVGWGVGDQEMCVMLGLADSRAIMDISVLGGTEVAGVDGDVLLHEGPCGVLALPENAAQTEPTAEEKEAPLYVPPSDPGDIDLEPVKRCVDADPTVPAKGAPSLEAIRGAIFQPGCVFSSCHDAKQPAAGLDLQSAGLHARLLAHQVAARVDVPLVAPGDAEGSWLYQIVSRCEPTDRDGQALRHMPYNAPTLLTDGNVALIRAWINAGAEDN
jgi:hypothetical protein